MNMNHHDGLPHVADALVLLVPFPPLPTLVHIHHAATNVIITKMVFHKIFFTFSFNYKQRNIKFEAVARLSLASLLNIYV